MAILKRLKIVIVDADKLVNDKKLSGCECFGIYKEVDWRKLA